MIFHCLSFRMVFNLMALSLTAMSAGVIYRNGRGDEEGRFTGPGVDRRGEESPFCRVQKRNRGEESLLENNLEHRTKGGEQGRRGETGDDSSVPISSRKRTQRHLRRYPRGFG